MSAKETIVEAFANLTWCLAWSDHVEEHGCYNLSGCRIEEHAPALPELARTLAAEAIAKVEQRMAQHKPLADAAQAAIAWLREYSDPSDSADIIAECEASPVCAALLVAARADSSKQYIDDVKCGVPPHRRKDDKERFTCKRAIVYFTDEDFAIRFGDCLAFQLPGHGVAWSDDHEEIPLPDMYDTTPCDRLRDVADECKEKPLKRR